MSLARSVDGQFLCIFYLFGTLCLPFGFRIRGTTWLATDASEYQDPYTLFSLLRAHNYLATPHSSASVSRSGLHILSPDKSNMGLGGLLGAPPPMRLWFPHIPSFSSPSIKAPGEDEKIHPPMRERSFIGVFILLSQSRHSSNLYTYRQPPTPRKSGPPDSRDALHRELERLCRHRGALPL